MNLLTLHGHCVFGIFLILLAISSGVVSSSIPGKVGEWIKLNPSPESPKLVSYSVKASQLKGNMMIASASLVEHVAQYPLGITINVHGQLTYMTLPAITHNGSHVDYKNSSKTVCIDPSYIQNITDLVVTVTVVSTNMAAATDVNFQLAIENRTLMVEHTLQAYIAPGSPFVGIFSFTETVSDSILVQVSSKDFKCALFSVQNTFCPIHDEPLNVNYKGKYQTMTSEANMILAKDAFVSPEFFIVVMMFSDNNTCDNGAFTHDINEAKSTWKEGMKEVSILVKNSITQMEYVVAIFALVGVYVVIIIIVLLFEFTVGRWTALKHFEEMRNLRLKNVADDETTHLENSTSNNTNVGSISTGVIPYGSSAENEHLQSSDEPAVSQVRMKQPVYINDLSMKQFSANDTKFGLYFYNLVVVSVFYALPAVQVFVVYIFNVNVNQDACYFNFLCSHPLGPIQSFNSLFSNIGFVVLGILFIVIIRIKSRWYSTWEAESRSALHQSIAPSGVGIPRHYGLFYALGVALVMEGIMSACYHVCPNSTNFQFDTTYMFIIACLLITKLFQTRHPDITKNPHAFFLFLAWVCFMAYLGLIVPSALVYVLCALVTMVLALYLASFFYYNGRVYEGCKRSRADLKNGHWRPKHPWRLVGSSVFIVVTLVFSVIGSIFNVKLTFDSFLLAMYVFILFSYLTVYMIAKLRVREHINVWTWLLLLLDLVVCGAAFYCYFHTQYTWNASPAASRTLNKKCVVLGFYDWHDIWHNLSAFGLFISFCFLLVIDDDVALVPRHRIKVF